MESSNKEIVMPMPSPSQRRNPFGRAVETGLFMLGNERTRDLVFPTRSIFHRGASYANRYTRCRIGEFSKKDQSPTLADRPGKAGPGFEWHPQSACAHVELSIRELTGV